MRETKTLEQRVLASLDDIEGTSVSLLKCELFPCDRDHRSFRRISATLHRLKKKGLAECAHGYMGWSWFSIPVSPSGATHENG